MLFVGFGVGFLGLFPVFWGGGVSLFFLKCSFFVFYFVFLQCFFEIEQKYVKYPPTTTTDKGYLRVTQTSYQNYIDTQYCMYT